jgi:GST-like protein
MPAIIDLEPQDGQGSLAVFESGAILLYLAEKSGQFMSTDFREKNQIIQWLMWQMGGLGPMAGQNGHFLLYAPEKIPYALERYAKEVNRLYGVLNTQLEKTDAFVAGPHYSIADMAIFPWVRTHKAQNVSLQEFSHVERWYNDVLKRPAVKRGLDLGKELRAPALSDEARKALFGQTANSVREGLHTPLDVLPHD